MSNKSNKTNGISKSTNKSVKGNTAVKKKDRTWIIYLTIGVVALVGIALLIGFASSSIANASDSQKTPQRQEQTVPDCCQ